MTNLPILEGVDHPDVCEEHGVFCCWYDDGSMESGPGEPYLDCPTCRDEQQHPVLHCDVCNTRQRTVSTSLVNSPFDPTCAYHLACGHVLI